MVIKSLIMTINSTFLDCYLKKIVQFTIFFVGQVVLSFGPLLYIFLNLDLIFQNFSNTLINVIF